MSVEPDEDLHSRDSEDEDEDFNPQEEDLDSDGESPKGRSGTHGNQRKRPFLALAEEDEPSGPTPERKNTALQPRQNSPEPEGEAATIGMETGPEHCGLRNGGVVGGAEQRDLDGEDGSDLGAREGRADPRLAAKRAKIDELWRGLGSRSKTVGSAAPNFLAGARLRSGFNKGMSLASLCQRIEDRPRKHDPDKFWMKDLGFGRADKRGELGASDVSAALRAAKLATSATAASRAHKVLIKEKAMFAGKEIEVTKELDRAQAAEPRGRPSGLDALLATLQGSRKVSVLDKSRQDWRTFKSSNAQVEEELETYKKSGDKYLDKEEFLKKAELRQYEIERDTRLASDARTRGRI
mmetsp:Transcript_8493/g.20387  ORF Transcript_8493/g.20387 Transcript_8493/m.20387 type:complete len:352 (-) Transcript_8493:299-1354(-)